MMEADRERGKTMVWPRHWRDQIESYLRVIRPAADDDLDAEMTNVGVRFWGQILLVGWQSSDPAIANW